MIFLFTITGVSLDCCFEYSGEQHSNYITHFTQDLAINLIRPYGLVHVQVPQKKR